MSGCNGTATCPKCGAVMQTYVDWKPHDIIEGECLECGFSFHTVDGQMILEEVNERRADYELEPLERLKEQGSDVDRREIADGDDRQ